jgi:hypothetical protein
MYILFLVSSCVFSASAQIIFEAKSHPIPYYKAKIALNNGQLMNVFPVKQSDSSLIVASRYYREIDLRVFDKLDTIPFHQINSIRFHEYLKVAKGFGRGFKFGAVVGLITGLSLFTVYYNPNSFLGPEFEFVLITGGLTSLGTLAGGFLGSIISPAVTGKNYKGPALQDALKNHTLKDFIYYQDSQWL